MEFIKTHEKLIKLLQILIDAGCVVYGTSVINFLIRHKTNKIDIYIPTKEANENIIKYKNYIECSKELDKTGDQYEIKQISKNKTMWKIDDAHLILTTKEPNPRHDVTQMIITKNGISTSTNSKTKGIDVLKTMRKLKKYGNFDDEFVTMSLDWITYLLNNDTNIYGSWPSRYITCEFPCDMKRDIDILCNDITNLHNLMDLLNKTGICKIQDGKKSKYEQLSINTEITTGFGILNLDIHQNSKNITCDAFHNNLRLSLDHLTINYKPHNINFLSTLILVINDLFHSSYTLIKPLPTKLEDIKNNGDLRLLIKPISFSETHVISTDYLEAFNDIDHKVNKLTDIILNGDCDRKNHIENLELDFISSVIKGKGDKKKICLHCVYDDLQSKKIDK